MRRHTQGAIARAPQPDYALAMPLLDHFHPPLSRERHWEAFHSRWGNAIADVLNEQLLPPNYFAEAHVHAGSPVEVDVAAFERHSGTAGQRQGGGTALLEAPTTYAPPAPAAVMPAIFPDSIEVRIFSSEAGPTLVAAVELISPGNKDRPESRRAFAMKSAAYLQAGVGLVMVDIITSRHANLHNELVDLMECASQFHLPPERLYAVSYRPARAAAQGTTDDRIELWSAMLAVGRPLPVLPLPLDKQQFVPLDLERTYAEVRQRTRLA